ncbi:hypothetical protein FKM82_001667 [Ascaphus truei]
MTNMGTGLPSTGNRSLDHNNTKNKSGNVGGINTPIKRKKIIAHLKRIGSHNIGKSQLKMNTKKLRTDWVGKCTADPYTV